MNEPSEHGWEQGSPTAANLIKALNHPLRRLLLRFLLDRGNRATSVEIRDAVTIHIAHTVVNHHLGTLAEYGAVVRRKEPFERAHVYFPTDAIKAEWFVTALSLTVAEDKILAAEIVHH